MTLLSHSRKLAAVDAALRQAGRKLPMDELLPLVEKRLEQVMGRTRLHKLIQTARSMGYKFTIEGRKPNVLYGVAK